VSASLRDRICSANGQWYFKGKSTKVGSGGSGSACVNTQLFCAGAGGKKYGYAVQQAKAVMVAIMSSGHVHPKAGASRPPCTPGLKGYWNNEFGKAGVSASLRDRICSANGQWYFKGKSTNVGSGGSGSACDKTKLFCAGAGGKKYGYAVQQAKAVKDAILRGPGKVHRKRR